MYFKMNEDSEISIFINEFNPLRKRTHAYTSIVIVSVTIFKY